MAKHSAVANEVKVAYIGAETIKEINSSLGKFRVRRSESGQRFIKTDEATAAKLVEKYPREFQGDSGTVGMTPKPRVAGKRTAGLDADEVEDAGGLDEEEKRLGEILSNPESKLE